MDIDFTCRDPAMKIPFPDEEYELWYPVELNRISPTVQKIPRYIIENKWFILPIQEDRRGNPPSALTFSLSAKVREWQEEATGSDKLWSDIMLLDVLSKTRKGQGRVKDVVKDWSIKSLVEQQFTLLNFRAATMAVMHELTHSIAMGLGNEIGV